jgi:hypothetical protein
LAACPRGVLVYSLASVVVPTCPVLALAGRFSGSDVVEPVIDTNSIGIAKVFAHTSSASGTINPLRSTSTARVLPPRWMLGPYTDDSSRPGRRLASCTVSWRWADAWNSCSVAAVGHYEGEILRGTPTADEIDPSDRVPRCAEWWGNEPRVDEQLTRVVAEDMRVRRVHDAGWRSSRQGRRAQFDQSVAALTLWHLRDAITDRLSTRIRSRESPPDPDAALGLLVATKDRCAFAAMRCHTCRHDEGIEDCTSALARRLPISEGEQCSSGY